MSVCYVFVFGLTPPNTIYHKGAEVYQKPPPLLSHSSNQTNDASF